MDVGVWIVIGAVLLLFAAGGYAATSRRGSNIDDRPQRGDYDKGGQTNAGARESDREGAPSDRGTR